MTTTLLPRQIAGLSEIIDAFPAVLCDVWGVVHDGLAPLPAGIDALLAYRRNGGVVMLISNAPRPAWAVMEQMDGIGVDRACGDDLITSGDVARSVFAEKPGARIFHLGPDRDHSIYQGLAVELSDLDSADIVSCTGLFDDQTEQPEDYDPMLAEMKALGLTMICVNPDIVVESGNRLIPCAGALAARYADIGGEAEIVGKPNRPIYDRALARIDARVGRHVPPERILAIGDGAGTDIVGANRAGLETLFIASGVHAAEYGAGKNLDAEAVGAFLDLRGTGASYFMPRLTW